jgi:hypothetical protein
VSYAGKISNRFFVGQVTDVDVKCYEMTFQRKGDNYDSVFAFPSKEDESWVEEEQIVEKLQVPTIDQRNNYHFCNPIIKTE